MATSMMTTRRKKRRPLFLRLWVISTVLILASVGLFTYELLAFSQSANRLAPNLIVADIDVSNLPPTDARILWERAYAQPVVLYYGDSPIVLDPSSVGFRPNVATMLASAQNINTSLGSFWERFLQYLTLQDTTQPVNIPLSADFQRGLLEQFLRDIASRYDRPPGEPSYDVVTLTTFNGQEGFALDIPQAMQLVESALRSPVNRTVLLPIGGATSNQPTLKTLQDLIIAYFDSQGFIYDGVSTIGSVFVMDLRTGEEINLLGDVAFTAASTVKLPIMLNYFRYQNNEPTQEEAWLLAQSLLCSRNSSSNLLMEITGGGNVFNGVAQVTGTAQFAGARNTFLSARLIEGVAGEQLGSISVPPTSPNPGYNTNPDPFNQTTTEDMGSLFTMIYDCANYGSGLITAFPEGEFSQLECRRMLELMSANDLERLLQGGIPPEIRISHKNGWLGGTVGDAGIVYPPNGRNYVIAVFLWEDVDFQDYTRLWPLLEDVSRAVWNYFSSDTSLLDRRQLPVTAQDCENNYLPPFGQVNLDDINAWRNQP
ncbi:MAG: serine hydrolase [Anaerolineae bacterium]|nr:serine hydrolase [Anaerolineae bacterium]